MSPQPPGEQDTALPQIINLTSKVASDGALTWTPPTAGEWEILRVGYTDSGAKVSTSSGAWQGLAIDYLDRGAFDRYWDSTVVPLMQVSKPYLKTTLVNLATDSWELGGTNWTGRFAEEFRRRRGYDPILYLPIVAGRIVDNRHTSARFLNDLRRTVGDLVTDHYDHFAERAHQYGLGIQAESGGPHGAPMDALETFRSSAVPQTEYWAESNEHRSTDGDRFFTKEAASAADIYGKKLVAQEGMTSIGPQWSESLGRDLKPSFDRALTEGMNRLVWHEFTSSPAKFGLPGIEYFAGTHLNPNVTWWNQGEAFFTYLNRCQLLLQQGHAVDDVLYFYGDQVPNFVRLKSEDPAGALPGFDYDVTNEDALLHSLKIESGHLVTPAGNRYAVLAMPAGRRISLAALERIATYVQEGGALTGAPPVEPTGLLGDAEARRFDNLRQQIWQNCTTADHAYGKGHVFCDGAARDALHALNVTPDFRDPSGKLDYVHRTDGSRDIYLVRNPASSPVDSTVDLRADGRTPELWNAVDGSVQPVIAYTQAAGSTQIPLHVPPYGTLFVVFGDMPKTHANEVTRHGSSVPAEPAEVALPATDWTMKFQEGRGAPGGSLPVDDFVSWSQSPNPGIRYFSGTATYSTHIRPEFRAGDRVILTLSEVHEICTVKVNGRTVGTIWAQPYELDLTDALAPGDNTLNLEVTNLWPNRIIGDAQPGTHTTFTHTNIRKYNATSPLLPSGLVGAIKLKVIHPAHGTVSAQSPK
jgi:hypothetical protein